MNAPRGGPIGVDANIKPAEGYEYEGCPSNIYVNPVGQEFRLVWRNGLNREDLGGQTPAPEIISLNY